MILETLQEAGTVLLLLCGYLIMWHFWKIKAKRKLKWNELSMYILTSVAVFLYAGTSLILLLS